ncbi:DUF4089 domain-containing protein, partial [Xanthomonas sp. Kuri4-1]
MQIPDDYRPGVQRNSALLDGYAALLHDFA